MPQDGHKTAPSALGATAGSPQESNILQTPKEQTLNVPLCLLASDGFLRPQDGPKMVQEGSKMPPRRPQERLRAP
eukprot:3227138-Pyramimonas_sp.AAC.1